MNHPDEYYLQDSRTICGNDMMFHGIIGGYTSDLNKARVFTREKAFKYHAQRDTDIPWPKSYIDSKSRPAVDFQYVNADEAAASLKPILNSIK
jgi:hypothetical protein